MHVGTKTRTEACKTTCISALLLIGAQACAGGASSAPVGGPEVAAASPATEMASAATAGPDPQRMYADCRERVEGPSTSGECTADAGCATAGCGGELCVSASAAASGISTTCEQRPCFQALDRCTCQSGQCTWTVKSSLPALPSNARPIQLPPKDAEGRVIRPAGPTAAEAPAVEPSP